MCGRFFFFGGGGKYTCQFSANWPCQGESYAMSSISDKPVKRGFANIYGLSAF